MTMDSDTRTPKCAHSQLVECEHCIDGASSVTSASAPPAKSMAERIADAMDVELGRAPATGGNADAIASAMDEQRGLTHDAAPAPSPGPGPQTSLVRESMANMRGARAVRDQAALRAQIADAMEQQGSAHFSIGGS